MYEGPSRLTGTIVTSTYPETARVKLPATGRVVRGRVVGHEDDGQVVVEWGGLTFTGDALPDVEP